MSPHPQRDSKALWHLGTWGSGTLGEQLDWMISKGFSRFNDSVIP